MTSYKGIVVLKHFGTLSPCLYWHAVIIFKYHVEEEELRPFLLHLGKLLPGWIFSWHFQSLTPETASSNVGNVMTKGHVILRNRASFSFSLLGRISTRTGPWIWGNPENVLIFQRRKVFSQKESWGWEKLNLSSKRIATLLYSSRYINDKKFKYFVPDFFFFFLYGTYRRHQVMFWNKAWDSISMICVSKFTNNFTLNLLYQNLY